MANEHITGIIQTELRKYSLNGLEIRKKKENQILNMSTFKSIKMSIDFLSKKLNFEILLLSIKILKNQRILLFN